MKYYNLPTAYEYQRRLNELQEQGTGVEDFKSWIIRYRQRDTARGDLAFDIYRDDRFPRGRNKEQMLFYLKYRLGRRTAPEAITAFHAAFRAYESHLRKQYEGSLLRELDRLQHELAMVQGADADIKKGSASEEESKEGDL